MGGTKRPAKTSAPVTKKKHKTEKAKERRNRVMSDTSKTFRVKRAYSTAAHAFITDEKVKELAADGQVFSKKKVWSKILKKDIYEHKLIKNLEGKNKQDIRKELITRVPAPLRWSHLLTEAQLKNIGYTQMDETPHYFRIDDGTEDGILWPYARYFSPENMNQLGLWEAMIEVQEVLAAPGTEKSLHKWTSKGAKTAYELGFTSQTGHYTIHPGDIQARNDPKFNRIGVLSIQIAMACIREAFPDRDWGTIEAYKAGNASLTMGDEENCETTNIQVNMTPAGITVAGTIKEFGHIHFDSDDNPAAFTAMFVVSNLPPDIFPGRFNLTGPRLTCSTPQFSCLVFKGLMPHFATGEGPYPDHITQDSPLRYQLPAGHKPYPQLDPSWAKKRINVVNFPKISLAKTKNYTDADAVRDQPFIGYYGTMRNRQEYKMLMAIKENVDVLDLFTNPLRSTALQRICDHFSWTDPTGMIQIPRLEKAELAYEWTGREIPGWNAEKANFDKLTCGARFIHAEVFQEELDAAERSGFVPREGDPKPEVVNRKTSTKSAKEKWTHTEYEFVFDPEGDRIPGNAEWKHGKPAMGGSFGVNRAGIMDGVVEEV
ncbi:hypothetical protein BGZ60DRAFT_418236 [Tricladium varicosporioides]|nr:hypothetical protein BGZ60DRAFT_418236 [Hymenoscyphus varicosporioides]